MLTEPCIDPDSLKIIAIPVLVTAGEKDLILRSETELIAFFGISLLHQRC